MHLTNAIRLTDHVKSIAKVRLDPTMHEQCAVLYTVKFRQIGSLHITSTCNTFVWLPCITQVPATYVSDDHALRVPGTCEVDEHTYIKVVEEGACAPCLK